MCSPFLRTRPAKRPSSNPNAFRSVTRSGKVIVTTLRNNSTLGFKQEQDAGSESPVWFSNRMKHRTSALWKIIVSGVPETFGDSHDRDAHASYHRFNPGPATAPHGARPVHPAVG